MSLEQIDELIERTEYNAALDELSVYMQKNPLDFDAAQKRVSTILKNRREYNEIAHHLLEVLETGEDGEEKSERVLEIIARLESLEKHPTDKNVAFIRQAKVAAQFTVYRSRYFAIMNEGSALAQSGQYVEAGQRFQDGFGLYRAEFDEEGYPAWLKKSVYDAVDDIGVQYKKIPALIESCRLASDEFVRAVKAEQLAASQQAFAQVLKSFSDYAAVRNRIAASGAVFVRQLAYLRQYDPYLPDASFLGFASRFTLGRASDPDTGVVGALDAFWNVRVEDMKSVLYGTVLSELAQMVSVPDDMLFREREAYAGQGALAPFAKGFASLGKDVQLLHGLLKNADTTAVAGTYTKYADSMSFANALPDHALASFGDMAQIASARPLRNRPGGEPLLPAGMEQEQYISRLLSAIRGHKKMEADSAATEEFLSAEKKRESPGDVHSGDETSANGFSGDNAGGVPKASGAESDQPAVATKVAATAGVAILDEALDFSSVCAAYGELNRKIGVEAQSGEGELWAVLALYCAGDADARLASLSSRYDESRTLCDGVEGDGASAKKYPSRTVELSQKLSLDVTQTRALLVGWRTTLSDGVAYRATNADYANGSDEIVRVISELDALLAKNNALAERARVQVQNAGRASNEAELRYNEAVAALKKNDFEGARDALQRARSKFNESLAFQENDSLRASSDSRLVALGAEIADRENEIVVREVRALKKQAWNAYFAGNFEEADTRLGQAKNRWAMTNVEEDREIVNLQALVSTALSMKTGRIIPPTAPLYPEMSQILNISNQYYNEGASLMKAGKNSEAKKVLNQAKEKLRNLLLVYPFNQEAGLLNLRIDQLIDEKEFNESFAQKIASAKKDYKNPETRQRAYTDLLDLHEINPKYPGLEKLIYDVEIEIGVRQKPVDRSGLQKSKNLTEQAQKIYSGAGRNEAKLRSALPLLDEAIALNPDNDDAITLKDRIQIAVGGKAMVVLSAADEMKYQQAIQALQRGDNASALAMVEDLLRSGTNRRSPKVLDLQKRLKDQL